MITVTKIVVMLLSALSILMLTMMLYMDVNSEVYKLLTIFDYLLCTVFLYDFVHQMYKAENRWQYFYTYGWLDLLSSIPVIPQFRYVRVFRIFRILRIIKSVRILVRFVRENKAMSLYGFVIFCVCTMLILCTTAVLHVEHDVGNIKTAEDALWWSFITITTVGYGDLYPVTSIGRALTVLLIISGVASFGALISYIEGKTSALRSKDGRTTKDI